MGIASWTGVAVVAGLLSGWFVAATLVKRDVDALGGDGDHVGRTVLLFGWLGVAFWLVKRRALVKKKAAPGRG